MSVEVSLKARLGDFALDAAFAVARRGVTALFGPSGAGKTTIVQAIAGLITPDEGRVVINGRVVLDTRTRIDVPASARRVGYVFQDSRLFPHMTVERNLLFGWRRAPERADAAAIARIVGLLGLESLLARRPRHLSGGEKQRVALGRALLAAPEILLLDEPMASLDGARRAEVLPYLERLRDEAGLPMLYVSHAVDEVARLADDIVFLRAGRVEAHGAVFDLLPSLDPASGGLFRATVTGHRDDGLSELAFDGGVLLVGKVARPPGSVLRVRIAAQDIMLAREEPRAISANNVLPATILSVAATAAPHAVVTIACGATKLMARITHASAHRLALAPGMTVFAIVKSVTVDPQLGDLAD